MNFSNHYDFVVLGEHPAGLWLAHHLLSLEKKVLVLPLGKDSGLNAVPKSVFRDFFQEESLSAVRTGPIQILTPERRFRLGLTPEEIDAEFLFQFGVSPNSQVVPEILRGLAYVARGSETGPVFAEDWSAWVKRALDTVYLGKEAGFLSARMLEILSKKGAHVSSVGELKQIFVDKKSLVGVQLDGTAQMISTQSGFICVNFDFLKSFLNESLPISSEPISWNFDMSFECAPAALPLGLSERMVYVESGAPVLEVLSKAPGYFELRSSLPISQRSFERPYQRLICERMIRVCEKIIPDLEYNLRRVVPDLRDPERTETMDLTRLFPFEDPKSIPLGRLVYSAARGLGHQTPIQNLFIVSEESNPRLGLRGAFEAAIQVLESLNRRDQVNHYLSAAHVNEFR